MQNDTGGLPPTTPLGQTSGRRVFDAPYAMLSILTLIYVSNAMDRHLIAILAEPIRLDLGLSDTQLGLLSGLVFAFFYAIFGVPVGWLADRFGRVRVITIACMAWSIFSALGALSLNFWHLAMSRIGVAIGEAGGSAPSYSLISDKFPPERRGNAIGLYHIASPISTLISVAAGGWIAQYYGWRIAVLAVSIPGVLLAIVLYFTVSEPKREEAAKVEHPPFLPAIASFFKDPVLCAIGLTAGLSSIGTYAMIAWIPAELMRVKGMSLVELGTYFGATSALSFAFGLWFGGWVSDRFAAVSIRAYALVPAVGMLLAAPFVILAAYMQGWQLSLALWMIPVALAAMFLAPAVTLVQNVSPPEQRGIYGAIYLLANNLIGAGFGPLVVGQVSDYFKPEHGDASLTFGMLSVAPLLVLGALGQYYVSRKLISREKPKQVAPA